MTTRDYSRTRVRTRVFLVIALNLIVAALWIWSQLETQQITIVATEQSIEAYVDGEFIVATRPPTSGGLVDFHLGPSSFVLDDPKQSPAVRGLVRVARESAWGHVTIRSLADGRVLLDTNLASGLGRFIPQSVGESHPLGDQTWSNYIVEATLLRPREPAGISVYGDGLTGVLFYFRPEHHDVGLWLGGSSGPEVLLDGGPYRGYQKSPTGAVQDVLRLLLGAYPLALAIGTVATALAWARRARAGRRRDASTRGLDQQWRDAEVGDVSSESRLWWLGAAGLAVLTLAVTGYVAYVILEHMPHVQDSVAYLFQAKVFARGQLFAPTPPMPEFFDHEFVVNSAGKWFAKYPPGHPLLLALGVVAGAPWLVNPIAAALSIVLIFVIGRKLYGASTGLIAAALAVTSPFLIFLSGSFMAHPTGLLCVLLFTWLFLRRQRLPSAFLCGCALGLGFLVRPWTAGVIAVPFAIVALSDLARRPRSALPASLLIAAGFLPFLTGWLAYNAALTGNPFHNTMELWWSFDKVGFGADRGPTGFWPIDGLANTSRNLGLLLTHLYGWPPFATLLFVTLPFVTGRARRSDALLLAAFLALVVGYFAWWADGVMYGPRFYYEASGFLFILTARGVAELAGLVNRARAGERDSRGSIGALIAGALVAGLVVCNLTFYLPGQLQQYRGYNFVNRGSLNAVESAGIHNAVVFTDVGGQYQWWWYGMVFSANSPFLDTDVIYARDLGRSADASLMTLYPGRAAYRLVQTTLQPLRP